MKKSIKGIKSIFMFPVFLLSAVAVNAECPEEQGYKMAQAMQAASTGWGDIQTDMEMIIKSPNGKEIKNILSSKILEGKEGDKSLLEFKEPITIAGSKLLGHTHNKADDEQWSYLPKTGKINQIGGKNKSGSFLGSQFSYEDMTSFKLEKYRYRYLRQEVCGAEQCSVITMYPDFKGSGYSKIISWIDKEMRVQKMEYYDRDDELLKTLSVKKYSKMEDKYWQPVESEMVNAQNGKITELKITNIRMRAGLKDSDFDKSILK